MRVCHVITTLDRGGAENHLSRLIEGQIEAGLSVTVLYLKGSGELAPTIEATGATVQRAPALLLARGTATNDFDIVHAHLPRAELYACCALRRSRLVVTRHLAGPFWPGAPAFLSRVASRLVERLSMQVICISQSVRDYMITSRHCRNEQKLKVVYYGYSSQTQELESMIAPKKPAADLNQLQLSCIARLVPQKDLPTLIKAVSQLVRRGIDCHVRIAGSGPELDSLQHLSVQLRVNQRFEFVGRINQPEEFIGSSEIFVLPSLFEGFGLVLLEAAAAEVPVIAARNTAMTEVIVDGESGLLFETGNAMDLADKIEELAKNPSLRRSLSEAARGRLESVFTVSRMVEETLNVYRSLFKDRNWRADW